MTAHDAARQAAADHCCPDSDHYHVGRCTKSGFDAGVAWAREQMSADVPGQRWTRFGLFVAGICPTCGAESLFLGHGGYVTCGNLKCTRPDHATDLLAALAQPVKPEAVEPPCIHWFGEPGVGPSTLHGNGPEHLGRGSGDEDEVTCRLCLTLLARRDGRDD